MNIFFNSISNPTEIFVNPIGIICYHCIIISNSIKAKTPAHPPAHTSLQNLYIYIYILALNAANAAG